MTAYRINFLIVIYLNFITIKRTKVKKRGWHLFQAPASLTFNYRLESDSGSDVQSQGHKDFCYLLIIPFWIITAILKINRCMSIGDIVNIEEQIKNSNIF